MGNYILYQYHGEMLTLDEIAVRCSRTKSTLVYRMRNHRCTAEEAADREWDNQERFEWTDGRMLTLAEISEITSIAPTTIRTRLHRGIPFIAACTKERCRSRDYHIDKVPQLSPEERYMQSGETNQRGAMNICRAMMGIDPRKVNLREVNYWFYLFDTDGIAFEITIMRDIATCIGKLKNNGNTLIERRYRIGENNIKEMAING